MSKGWLGGRDAEMEAEEEEQIKKEQEESSQKIYAVLKKNKEELISKKIGLNGEPIEMPPFYSESDEEVILLEPCSEEGEAELSKKGSAASLEHIVKATGILSSLLREMIAVGATQSWVGKENRPDQRFVDIEVEHLKQAIKQLVPRNDRNLVHRMLRDEVSIKRERDRIVGDILLCFAFPDCS